MQFMKSRSVLALRGFASGKFPGKTGSFYNWVFTDDPEVCYDNQQDFHQRLAK